MEERQRWTWAGQKGMITPWQMEAFSTFCRGLSPQPVPSTSWCRRMWHSVKGPPEESDSSSPKAALVSLEATAWFLNPQDHTTNPFCLLLTKKRLTMNSFLTLTFLLERAHTSH